jgi:hypothetical protein
MHIFKDLSGKTGNGSLLTIWGTPGKSTKPTKPTKLPMGKYGKKKNLLSLIVPIYDAAGWRLPPRWLANIHQIIVPADATGHSSFLNG